MSSRGDGYEGRAVAMNDVLLCPFDSERCSFPDGEHFKSEDFVGCKVVDYVHGNEVIRWVCPRFPVDMSITAVRDAFMRLHSEKEHERKRMRQKADSL